MVVNRTQIRNNSSGKLLSKAGITLEKVNVVKQEVSAEGTENSQILWRRLRLLVWRHNNKALFHYPGAPFQLSVPTFTALMGKVM